jgi:hypothetical protein
LARPKSTAARATLPVLGGLLFFAVLGLIAWGIAALVSSNAGPNGNVQVNLGQDVFNMGPAKQRAEEVAERGPLLFPGLIAADEGYIVVNHSGTEPLAGWKAFAAVPPGSGIECAVQWQAGAQQFKDPCTGTVYPADGTGLTAYRVELTTDNDLVIDLGRGAASTG